MIKDSAERSTSEADSHIIDFSLRVYKNGCYVDIY